MIMVPLFCGIVIRDSPPHYILYFVSRQEDEFAALEEEETNEVESPRPKSVTGNLKA